MSDQQSIRGQYEKHGVQGFYEQYGDQYRNPHEFAIREVLARAVTTWQPDLAHVLDLACGSGEVTLALKELGCTRIDGIDPYTGNAYTERTGQHAEPFTFAQIASGILSGRHYSLIVCSFALHLLEDSRLPTLAYQLSLITDGLLILTPHKRPEIDASWGWTIVGELVEDRVRARYYKSSSGMR